MMRRDLSSDLRREARLGLLVLIADDSPTVRIVTRHALEHAGLQTVGVATPREVIAAAGEVLPELFLLDITFATGAQTDGYELCRWLCERPEFRVTPILLVSGHGGSSTNCVDGWRARRATAPSHSRWLN